MRRRFSGLSLTSMGRHLFGRPIQSAPKQFPSTPRSTPFARRLRCEPLEDRRMLSITLFVDADAAPSGDGLAWGTAYNNLQAALDQAAIYNTDTIVTNNVNQIWIAEGTYKPTAKLEPGDARSASFSLLDKVTLYGGFEGSETTIEERNTDPTVHETIFSGDLGAIEDDADNAYTVIYCGEGIEAGLDGLTITAGKTTFGSDAGHPERNHGGGIFTKGVLTISFAVITGNSAHDQGGGIYNDNGVCTLTDSTLSDNSSSYGGGIFNSGTLSVETSTLSDNSAGVGGAIYNECSTETDLLSVTGCTITGNSANTAGGIYNKNSTMTVATSTFSDNSADYFQSDGGGIYNHAAGSSATLTVTDSIFSCNSATTRGGGISNFGDSGSASLTVEDSTFSENSVLNGLGGGISSYVSYGGTAAVTLRKSTFSENSASAGGAISIFSDGEATTLLVTDCAIQGNSANRNGGGIYSETDHGATWITVTGSTISGNSSKHNSGGGIYNSGDSATLIVSDTRISGNFTESEGGVEDYGGGIYNSYGMLSITRSTISGNSAGVGGGVCNDSYSNSQGMLTISDSLIANNTASRDGGGIASGGNATIVNSTITNNMLTSEHPFSGAGIANYGNMKIVNSTVVYNSSESPGPGGIYFQGILTAQNTVIAKNSSKRESPHQSNFVDINDILSTESTNNFIGSEDGDPLLMLVTDERGLARYYMPRPDSPLVDAGNDTAASDAGLAQDQRGNSRFVDSLYTGNDIVDIGAIELQTNPELVIAPTAKYEIIEGRSTDITVCLSSAPTEPVEITLTKQSGGSEDISINTPTLLFDETNWDILQTVTISIAPDDDFEQDSAIFGLFSAEMETYFVSVTSREIYVVDSLQDIVAEDGFITLREAIEAANSNEVVCDARGGFADQADIITFDSSLFDSGPVAIILDGSALGIGSELEIYGPGAELLSIDANDQSRVMDVSGDATIDALSITGGNMSGIHHKYRTLIITNSNISGNLADFGGGIYSESGTLIIENSTISGNRANLSGGGIYSETILTVTNSIIMANTSYRDGGGIYSNHSVYVTNSTVTANYASGMGAGIFAGYKSKITNSIIALNHNADDFGGWLFPESTNNLIGVDPVFVITPSDGGDGWGDNPITPDIDESLNDDYGDLQLAYGSPAINAGKNDLAMDNEGHPLVTDIDGNPRIINGTVDIGAYESSEPARLPGDANLDKAVTNADALIVSGNWLMQSGATWADGDFNGDGRVDSIDATLLAANLHTTPDPPDTSPTAATEPEAGHVSCDLDNDGHVGLGDLALFASVYREKPGLTTENPCAYAADFDRSGTVDLGDLALFAADYHLGRSDASIACTAKASQLNSPAPETALTIAEIPAEKTATLLPGDADLDGTVNDNDARLLAMHWLMNAEDPDDDRPDGEKDAAHDLFFDTVV